MAAIFSPNTGILDWAEVARNYGADFKKAGGDIYTGFEVRLMSKSNSLLLVRSRLANMNIIEGVLIKT